MFTGIIEEVGVVKRISRRGGLARLAVDAAVVARDIKVGDSIAVNGACLTVVELNQSSISFDIMETTLKTTNLGKFKARDYVNLERSLETGDRLSGHLLSGHVDGVGRLKNKRALKDNLTLQIEAPSSIIRYLVPKGSVACDGISLTVAELGRDYFTVHIIPHTLKMTNLGSRKVGDVLNLEVDMLGKFVYKYLAERENKGSKVSEKFLSEHGFI